MLQDTSTTTRTRVRLSVQNVAIALTVFAVAAGVVLGGWVFPPKPTRQLIVPPTPAVQTAYKPGSLLVLLKEGVPVDGADASGEEKDGVVRAGPLVIRSASLASLTSMYQVTAYVPLLPPKSVILASLAKRVFEVQFDPAADHTLVLDAFRQSPDVASVDLNYPFTPLLDLPPEMPPSWPNDPYFFSSGAWGQPERDEWNLVQIKAREAWAESLANGTIVAVTDSGVDYTHPDLRNNVWVNAGEPEIPNQLDDDGNGYVDDHWGFDFGNGTYVGDVWLNDANGVQDTGSHGTHLNGIIAAETNNREGIASVCPSCTLLNSQIYTGGNYNADRLIAALGYSIENGARVVNMSFRGSPTTSLDTIIQTAYQNGIIFVAAAGNDFNGSVTYPASNAFVMGVAGSTPQDEHANHSSIGSEVDVAAPGFGPNPPAFPGPPSSPYVLSTLSSFAPRDPQLPYIVGNRYLRMNGTSMATPHVAGAAAMLYDYRVQHNLLADPLTIQNVIRQSSDDSNAALYPGWDPYLGNGRLNMERALTIREPLRASITSPTLDQGLRFGATVSILGSAGGAGFASYEVSYAFEDNLQSWQVIGSGTGPVTNGTLVTWTVPATGYFRAYLRLKVTGADGQTLSDGRQVMLTN